MSDDRPAPVIPSVPPPFPDLVSPPLVVRGYTERGQEIRVLSDASIQAQVDRVLASLPATTKGVVVAHASLVGDGQVYSLAAKLPGGHWSFAAYAYDRPAVPLEAGVAVKLEWGED